MTTPFSRDPIVIVGAKRTPLGAFQGALASLSTTDLGGHAINAALKDANIDPSLVDEVLMGCVLSAGLGQAPARQAAIKAGIPHGTPCATVNKVCGSGMKTIMLAHDILAAGSAQIAVAGGMESMTNAPYLLTKARGGFRLGHGDVYDHMFHDGLEDAYQKGRLMGTFAEDTAKKYNFTREAQDAFATESTKRAVKAIEEGLLETEVSTIIAKIGRENVEVSKDEPPFKVNPAKIPTLKPAFRENGTVTAATSSSLSDGAAALVLMRESTANARGLKIRARILGHTSYSHAPEWFTTAPVGAIRKLQEKLNWSEKDVDLYEINEAFAVVPMAAMHDLQISHDKVNVWGGACSLGHPIGASGSRVIVTLLHALEHYKLNHGVASVCIGGGESTAIAIERV